MRRFLAAIAIGAAVTVVPIAVADPGDGPPMGPFDKQNAVWGCSPSDGVPLPPNHCINLKSNGNTGVIKVFSPDERWPQESISTDPKSDSRPCPHDPDADPDGTWWSPQPGIWVCHHRP